MRIGYLALAGSALLYAGSAQAQSFINGGFEAGTTNGWTTGGGYRAGIPNGSLDPATFTTPAGRSAIIGTSCSKS